MNLTSHTQTRIVELYRKKMSPSSIGLRFGISASTVRRILLRNKVRMRGPGRPSKV